MEQQTRAGRGPCGTVYKVTLAGTKTVLVSFQGLPSDGANPTAGLNADSKGNFYGTTQRGSSLSSLGTPFEFSPTSGYKLLQRSAARVHATESFRWAGSLPTEMAISMARPKWEGRQRLAPADAGKSSSFRQRPEL